MPGVGRQVLVLTLFLSGSLLPPFALCRWLTASFRLHRCLGGHCVSAVPQSKKLPPSSSEADAPRSTQSPPSSREAVAPQATKPPPSSSEADSRSREDVRPQCARLTGREEGFWSGDTVNESGVWLAADGRFGTRLRFDLRECRLRRYAAADAKRCLAKKHLVMVGDSLMRYQYLSLVHLLAKGRYPESGLPVWKYRRGEEEQPNVCQEGDYLLLGRWLEKKFGRQNASALRGWPAFMIDTSQRFGFSERCDCWRGTAETTVENRFFKDPESGAAITYFTKIGVPMHGHWPFPNTSQLPPSSITPEIYKETGRMNSTWAVSNDQFIRDVLPRVEELQGPVNHIVWNQGMWGQMNKQEMEKLSLTAHAFLSNRSGSGSFFWKTTTRTGTVNKAVDLENEMKSEERTADTIGSLGWRLLDAAKMTRDFTFSLNASNVTKWEKLIDAGPVPAVNESLHLDLMALHWDHVHYLPWVYEEINNVWLNLMCNE